jgi:hypothetical protein
MTESELRVKVRYGYPLRVSPEEIGMKAHKDVQTSDDVRHGFESQTFHNKSQKFLILGSFYDDYEPNITYL